ncbi:MAG: murein L,D-transpeptidase family protein [Qingshengfaniella sp.]
MRALLRILLLVIAGAALVACGESKFQGYDGPQVTQIFVSKSNRRLYLLNGHDILKAYDIDLGFAPEGHKQIEGDGRTPEGMYRIDRRNPNSAFHLSVGISYPNRRDVENAKMLGASPGGDIFIHGQPVVGQANGPDWTAGCIAVTNEEIEEIYAMVPDGTPIYLAP